MICVKCGLSKSGRNGFFVCDDCNEFSPIIQTVYRVIDESISNAEVIDPETNRLLQLIADCTFVTANNPQTAIFYKICEYIIHKAYSQEYEITENELNKSVRTTRAWGEIFRLFQELDLNSVRVEEYQRILVLTDKTRKLAAQFDTDSSRSEQVIKRLAHIYAGYVLLYILYEMSNITPNESEIRLPYGNKLKTLWNVLMFLWVKAYNGTDEFSDEDFVKFVSKRRIPSTTRGEILRALNTMSGRTVQGLIKEVIVNEDQIKFKFEDYVLVEMERIRERVRENRER